MYMLIQFPEIQQYQELEGFEENACLANDEEFLETNDITNSAYFVDKKWLELKNKLI